LTSDQDLIEWWESLTYEQRLEEIKKYDSIEHALPEVEPGDLVIILDDNGDLILSQQEIIIGIDYLSYKITLEERIIENFHIEEKPNFTPYLIGGLVGIGLSILIGVLI